MKSNKENLIEKNIDLTYELYKQIDLQIEEFIQNNINEIVKFCQEKKSLGMDTKMTFTSPLRVWNFVVENNKNTVTQTTIITKINPNSHEDENIFYQKQISNKNTA